MTVKEAINIIMNMSFFKAVIKNIKHTGHEPENNDLYYALKMAISALKKQEPMKPYLEGDGYSDGELVYDTWICQNCGEHYEVDYDDYEYCPKCGQHIDWSQEENECRNMESEQE